MSSKKATLADQLKRRAGNTSATGSVFSDRNEDLAEKLRQVATRTELSAVISSSDIKTAGFRWTKLGLIADDTATKEGWVETGRILSMLNSSLQWLIGDWFVYGETNYGAITSLADDMGLSEATIRDYVYVARNVEMSVRTDISFGHHKLVAAMGKKDQRHWLSLAIANNWSVARLRNEIRNTPNLPEPRVTDKISTGIHKLIQSAKKLPDNERQQIIRELEIAIKKLKEV